SRLVRQCLFQRVERRCARCESLAVPSQLEAGIDTNSPDIREIIDIQARQVTRLLRRTQRTESSEQPLVGLRRLHRLSRAQLLEARPFREKRAPDDTQR